MSISAIKNGGQIKLGRRFFMNLILNFRVNI